MSKWFIKKKIIIMRGLPRSGKSTIVNKLKHQFVNPVICSADDHFMVEGVYKFKPEDLQIAHEKCFEKFKDAVINTSVDAVIVDNTNIKLHHYDSYIRFAMKSLGYTWEDIIICDLIESGNVQIDEYVDHTDDPCPHGIPRSTIERMLKSYESHPQQDPVFQ